MSPQIYVAVLFFMVHHVDASKKFVGFYQQNRGILDQLHMISEHL